MFYLDNVEVQLFKTTIIYANFYIRPPLSLSSHAKSLLLQVVVQGHLFLQMITGDLNWLFDLKAICFHF